MARSRGGIRGSGSGPDNGGAVYGLMVGLEQMRCAG